MINYRLIMPIPNEDVKKKKKKKVLEPVISGKHQVLHILESPIFFLWSDLKLFRVNKVFPFHGTF